jgi:hypothetical protein
MSAEPVYKFIEECLKVIRKDSTAPPAFTKIPELPDINIIEPTAAALPVSFASVNILNIDTIKTALKELLPVIGYDSTKDPIFLKKFDSKTAAKPASGYWAINIDTGNAWLIDQYKPSPPLYGGKKRKTNRRKHRRSNRKTLGRKK